MPTANPRLNVVLEQKLFKIIKQMAQKEDKSMSEMAKQLMVLAIENHEDILLSHIAEKREKLSQKTVSHKEAWK